MKRLLTFFLFTLLLAGNANCFPWKKVLVAGAAAGVHAYGLHHCRVHGVERCEAHYGNAWWSFGTWTAVNFALIPVSEKVGGKQGDALSYGGSAAQLGFGINQWRQGGDIDVQEENKSLSTNRKIWTLDTSSGFLSTRSIKFQPSSLMSLRLRDGGSGLQKLFSRGSQQKLWLSTPRYYFKYETWTSRNSQR